MLKDEMEKRLKRVQESFATLDHIPKDRLEYLDYSLRARVIMIDASSFLDELRRPSLSAQYPEDDLKMIHGHFCEAARCLLELIKHYYEKIIEEMEASADENPFAT